jgi:hypothetical protein
MVRATRLTLYGEQAGAPHSPWRAAEDCRAAHNVERR